jgi:FkbM family methyltransferase
MAIYIRNNLYKIVKQNDSLKFLFRFTRVGRLMSGYPGGGVVFFENFKLYIPLDREEFAESLLFHGFNDPDTLEIIRTFNSQKTASDKKFIFLDLGASYGYWSLFLSRYGFIPIAVEGSSEVAKVGKINFILNSLPIENYLEFWVIPKNEKTYFKHETKFSFTNHLSTTGSEVLANTCTLSDLISDHEPTLLKLDLEGVDIAVLLSTEKELLAKLTYIVIEVENGSDGAEEIKEFLSELGFERRKVFSVQGKVINGQSRTLANMHFVKQENLTASLG